MVRDRLAPKAADEASVDVSLNRGLGIARVAATARRSRGQRPRNCRNQAGLPERADRKVRRYAKEETNGTLRD